MDSLRAWLCPTPWHRLRVAEAGARTRKVRIVAVGASADVRAAMGGDAEVLVLGDTAVLPGFIDAHHHYCFAAFDRRRPDVRHQADTPMEALLSRVGDIAAQRSEGWVRCRGYEPAKLRERRPPRLEELNEVCPDRPLFLQSYSGHEACLNAAGFAARGDRGRVVGRGRSSREGACAVWDHACRGPRRAPVV